MVMSGATATSQRCTSMVTPRDPQTLPVCEECKDIWQTYKEFNDGFGDSPNI